MSADAPDTMVLVAALILLGGFFCALVVKVRANRRLTYQWSLLERRLATLEHQFTSLCAAEAQLGDRLIASEGELRAMYERQLQLELKQPVAGHYRHAISMVELGASTVELVSNCGLSQGEAELILRMHGGPGAAQGAKEEVISNPI